MVDGFDGLRHNAVIGSHYQNGNIGYLGAAGAHGSKSLMARCIQEGDLLSVGFHLIRTDMLGDTACFGGGDMGRTDLIQQRGFPMVNVTHNGNHRRTIFQIFRFVFHIGKQFFLFGYLHFNRCTEFFGDDGGCIDVQILVDGGHHAHGHQLHDNVGSLFAQLTGQILYGDAVFQHHMVFHFGKLSWRLFLDIFIVFAFCLVIFIIFALEIAVFIAFGAGYLFRFGFGATAAAIPVLIPFFHSVSGKVFIVVFACRRCFRLLRSYRSRRCDPVGIGTYFAAAGRFLTVFPEAPITVAVFSAIAAWFFTGTSGTIPVGLILPVLFILSFIIAFILFMKPIAVFSVIAVLSVVPIVSIVFLIPVRTSVPVFSAGRSGGTALRSLTGFLCHIFFPILPVRMISILTA